MNNKIRFHAYQLHTFIIQTVYSAGKIYAEAVE